MSSRLLWLLAVSPALLEAQIVLYSLNGVTPVPLPSSFSYGSVAAGDASTVRFRALNAGVTSVTITCLGIVNSTGTGFSVVNSSSTPFVVAPGQPMDFFVRFSAVVIAAYRATLEVGTGTATDACGGIVESAILTATTVPAAILTVAAPCTGPDGNNNIGFGRIAQTTAVSCAFSLSNPFTEALAVSPVNVTGAAFTSTSGNSITIGAGQSASFSIQFSPPAGSSYSGVLKVGTRTYNLAGTGFSSPLPSILWTFDSGKIASGEQHTLSLQLSTPSTVAATGTLTLGFVPAIKTVSDDTTVQFVATAKRVASFAVNAGATAITLNGQPNIVFSTGTTGGTLTFTVDPGIYGLSGNPATSITTSPAAVFLTSSAVTNRANALDLVISGFDNTYSMGGMSFVFVDRGGAPMATLPADFTANFSAFFQGQAAGSSFLMRVTFPVSGDVSQVGGVTAVLNNAAGAVSTPRLTFP